MKNIYLVCSEDANFNTGTADQVKLDK